MKRLVISILVLLIIAGCNGGTSTKTTLVVGMECDYAPFNWTQLEDSQTAVLIDGGQSGYADGYDVAIAQSIADELGLELVVKKIEWDGLTMAVVNNEIDLIIAGMTDTLERRESLTFTTPYYVSEMVLIVRSDSAYANATNIQDFSGARVVAQLNTFHDDIIDQINGVKHETPMLTFPLMTVALQNKVVDAMVSELPVAVSICNNNPDLIYINFTGANGFDAGDDATVSIGLAKNNADLFASVQAALNKITPETRIQMMADAQERQPE